MKINHLPSSSCKTTATRQSSPLRIPIFTTVLLAGILGFSQLFASSQSVNALTADDPLTIPACNSNPECFAFGIDTRLTETGNITNTNTTFSVPISGRVNNTDNSYNWIVNWGDGTETTHSGTGNTTSAGISHTYSSAGPYQIAIRPAVAATDGWFNAFGFYQNTSGANTTTNKYLFRSINTPFTNLMRTQGSAYRFAYTFYGARNSTEIPNNLFANVSTIGSTNLTGMFAHTFFEYAYNSTTATIPAGLFDSLDTSSGRRFSWTFRNTFDYYAYNSAIGTIPTSLFGSINTSSGTDFPQMFDGTFSNYAYSSAAGTIPANLFSSIITSSGTDFFDMFNATFFNYARRSASFAVNGSIVATSSQFQGPYAVKIGSGGAPNTNPTLNAATANQVIPTYDATTRTITAPGGTYASYRWHRTDGTSCLVASPTPNCGAQNAGTLVTFPNTTEWIQTTSTEKGDVTFYAETATVTFDSKGGSSVPSQTIAAGSTATKPTDPIRDHYSFNHWYVCTDVTETAYVFSTTVWTDLALCAKWNINSYTVTFNSMGGSSVTNQTIPAGSTATKPTDPTRNHYSFDYWYVCTDPTLTEYAFFITPVLANLSLCAQWALNNYAVSFDSTGGSSVTSQIIPAGSTATQPPDPTRTGHDFEYWYLCTDMIRLAFNFTSPIWSNTELCARWTLDNYVIIFMSAGEIYLVLHVDHDNPIPTPADPTRTDYRFLGWYTDETFTTEFDFDTPATEDLTIYAQWERLPSLPDTGFFNQNLSGTVISTGTIAIFTLIGSILLIRHRMTKKPQRLFY